ncbi:YjeF N-terminal domain-containing protein, partial [Obelidium mucronatum]
MERPRGMTAQPPPHKQPLLPEAASDDSEIDFAALAGAASSSSGARNRFASIAKSASPSRSKPPAAISRSPVVSTRTPQPPKKRGSSTPQQPQGGPSKNVKNASAAKNSTHQRTNSHHAHHHHHSTNSTSTQKATFVVEPTVDISQDFDFQSSLEKFDKQRIFAEIRASEEELGFESGGGAGGFNGKDRIGVREMVLESGEETGNNASAEDDFGDDDDDFDDDEEDFGGDVDFNRPNQQTVDSGIVLSNVSARRGNKKRPVFKSTGGVLVYGITTAEMAEVERLAVTETGPNETQMIENAGRGAAMLVMQALGEFFYFLFASQLSVESLGGARRIKAGNHNAAPIVVVLAGNNKVGAYGLCTARHLANHEVTVVVSVVGGEAELVNTVSYQRKIFLPTGGKVIKQVSELPQIGEPVDLIVDSLLGATQQILDLSETDRSLTCDLMKWGNENRADILSLDIPSGFNASTGIPTSQALHISAKWTLSFGLPKSCLGKIAREITGELFLADIGIPKLVYQKLKVAPKVGGGGGGIRYIPPFGDKYLVGLTYDQ